MYTVLQRARECLYSRINEEIKQTFKLSSENCKFLFQSTSILNKNNQIDEQQGACTRKGKQSAVDFNLKLIAMIVDLPDA